MPHVSVVISTYNRSGLLRQALTSALRQRDVDLEVVVVDNGSTDDTLAVLEQVDDSRLRVIRNAVSTGPTRGRNAGLAVAQGEWVALLDDDGATLTVVALEGEPPSLQILHPQDGDVLDETTVARWDASEDVVVFLLEYTWDGGESWDVVAGSWTEQTYTFDPEHLPASTEEGASRLRVTASNGAMSTTAVSGGFTVTWDHP
jgi:glycosyltransferase involved in cell wall biosynthesis